MWGHDRSVDPPAPFVDIRISPPLNLTLGQPLRAKLDTAADILCIPADLEVAAAQFHHLEVVTIPEKYALLGRDALNYFYVQLNGPDLTFNMGTSP